MQSDQFPNERYKIPAHNYSVWDSRSPPPPSPLAQPFIFTASPQRNYAATHLACLEQQFAELDRRRATHGSSLGRIFPNLCSHDRSHSLPLSLSLSLARSLRGKKERSTASNKHVGLSHCLTISLSLELLGSLSLSLPHTHTNTLIC